MTRSKSNPGMWRSSNGRYGVSSDEEVESSRAKKTLRLVGGTWVAVTCALPQRPSLHHPVGGTWVAVAVVLPQRPSLHHHFPFLLLLLFERQHLQGDFRKTIQLGLTKTFPSSLLLPSTNAGSRS